MVAVFVGLLALAVASAWAMRRLLDALIDERADAIVFGVVFGAGSIALLIGSGLYARFRPTAGRNRVAIGLGVLGGCLLLGGVLGGTGGRRATTRQLAALDRDLHGFREYFLYSAAAAIVLVAIVGAVVNRSQTATEPASGGEPLPPPQV